MKDAKQFLMTLFNRAVHVCLPSECLEAHLQAIDTSKGVCVIGAGKAAADMAATVYRAYGEQCYGAVVTRYGYETKDPTGKIKVLLAAHPVPDENSLIAAQTLLQIVADNPADIPIVFLISGGGSALMSMPAEGIAFAGKLEIHRFLLRSGASIDEMNVVRKQLSGVKGGRLAAAAKSEYYTLVISDVVGDDPSLIASGPTVPDSSTKEQALLILQKYQWAPIQSVQHYLGKNTVASKPYINDNGYKIIANANLAIDSASLLAKESGKEVQVLNYQQQGEAADVAREHAAIALKLQAQGREVILLSGGELTVTLSSGSGQGGPNQEYMLALAIALQGAKGICALSCDTDGVDGSQDIAGAYIDNTTLERAAVNGLDPQVYLCNHNSYHFFKTIDGLIVTGPTHTNVNDFRAIMIEQP